MRLSEIVKDESIRKLILDCKNAGFPIEKRVNEHCTRISGTYIISTDMPENWYGGTASPHPKAELHVLIYDDRYEVSFNINSGYCWWDTADRILGLKPSPRWGSHFDRVEDDDEIHLAIQKIKMIVITNILLLSDSNPRTEDDFQSGPTRFIINIRKENI